MNEGNVPLSHRLLIHPGILARGARAFYFRGRGRALQRHCSVGGLLDAVAVRDPMGLDLFPESSFHCAIQRPVEWILGIARHVVLGEGLSVKVEPCLTSDLVRCVRIDDLVTGDVPSPGHLKVEEADG
eukprot:scaffold51772_cov35-Phaeocystis_antarctica.AAC.3